MIVDLHTHTNRSDGTLSAIELLQGAVDAGIELLSITDHDTIAAYQDLEVDLTKQSLTIVPGIEFSTKWRTTGVHVLGLNIDLASDAIDAATKFQLDARRLRAERIAERLERAGLADTLPGAMAIAKWGAVGRPHFARHLVDRGVVKNTSEAFKKYLGAGKAGDVKQHWASFEQIIEWIRASGGTPVLAHPGKYGLSRTKRIALIEDFRRYGGQAIEVISGQQDPMLTQSLTATATEHGLLASCGSDFHRVGQPWARLGMPLSLPAACRPVWETW
jgi:predicted metal-dependent phosphoesterase TrpH